MPVILITLFAFSLFPVVLSGIGHYFRVKQFGRVDNDHPRQQQARLEGTGARVMAAQSNAWESLAVYTLVIFIAFAMGVDLHTLTTPALVFISFRLLHALFYIVNLATLRSLSFAVSLFTCIYIFYVTATVQ
ncbi:MAG: MAPEG family protein [Pseudohongiellaceae bacterium]